MFLFICIGGYSCLLCSFNCNSCSIVLMCFCLLFCPKIAFFGRRHLYIKNNFLNLHYHKQHSTMADKDSYNHKWSEITLLPEWEEEFYNVYRAKKYGKWVMLKCLKPEYAERPEFQVLIEKEFDARYNLAHANIAMINDFEPIEGLGQCIITDNVYGKSLRELIDSKDISPDLLAKIQTQLPDALAYIQENHIVHRPLRPEMILITEEAKNIKLIDVGFDQKNSLPKQSCLEDIYNYGLILKEVLAVLPTKMPHLKHIADRCTDNNPRRRYQDVQELRLAIERRSSNSIYTAIIIFIVIMSILLAWLNSRNSPEHKQENVAIEATK